MPTRFDSAADTWDTPLRVARAKEIAETIGRDIPPAATNAMEYGCGTGLISFLLHDRLAAIDLFDSSEGMIRELDRKILQTRAANMHAVHGDLSIGGETPGMYEVIYTSMVLHHIADIGGILARFYGALHPGGRLIVVDLDPDDGTFHSGEPEFDGHHGFHQPRFRQMLTDAGFVNPSSETFYRSEKRIGEKSHPYSLFIARADKPAEHK